MLSYTSIVELLRNYVAREDTPAQALRKRTMASGQGQIGHIGVEVPVAFRAAMLGVGNNQIAGPPGKRLSQIVQRTRANTKAIGSVLAVGTGSALKVAAGLDRFGFR